MTTENNVDSPVHEGDDQQKTDEACSAFFGFRPALCFQNVYKRCRKHGCKSEIERGKNRVATALRIAWQSNYLWGCVRAVEVLVVGGAVAYCLLRWRSGDMTNNDVIAMFTVAMAYTTLRAWIAMHVQNTIMIEQGNAIEKQAALAEKQLEIAKRSVEQTQVTIDRSALDSRAWLSALQPFLKKESGAIVPEFTANEMFMAVVPIRNLGKTPAYITGHAVDMNIHDNDDAIPAVIQLCLRAARGVPRETAVAADMTINSHCTIKQFTEVQVSQINEHHTQLHLAGAVIYRDVYNTSHEMHYVLFWDPDGKTFKLTSKYQYMD